MQWWVSEQREQGEDVFSIADFMPVGIELVGDKIRDTPIGESQQEDWMQMPPASQIPNLTCPSLPQVMVVDNGLVNPQHQRSKEEQV